MVLVAAPHQHFEHIIAHDCACGDVSAREDDIAAHQCSGVQGCSVGCEASDVQTEVPLFRHERCSCIAA
jgi:hypothetical protein